jgi:hypothetical protein
MLRKGLESEGGEISTEDFIKIGRARRKQAEWTELSRSEVAYRAYAL